jgi:hypothetical protein
MVIRSCQMCGTSDVELFDGICAECKTDVDECMASLAKDAWDEVVPEVWDARPPLAQLGLEEWNEDDNYDVIREPQGNVHP